LFPTSISISQSDYYPRILYDTVFFIWVGLVLTNIITGLMVDTFSAIREEEAERKEVLLQLHVSISSVMFSFHALLLHNDMFRRSKRNALCVGSLVQYTTI